MNKNIEIEFDFKGYKTVPSFHYTREVGMLRGYAKYKKGYFNDTSFTITKNSSKKEKNKWKNNFKLRANICLNFYSYRNSIKNLSEKDLKIEIKKILNSNNYILEQSSKIHYTAGAFRMLYAPKDNGSFSGIANKTMIGLVLKVYLEFQIKKKLNNQSIESEIRNILLKKIA